MDKPKYKFSPKVFGVGILLLLLSFGGSYYQYLEISHHKALNLMWMFLMVVLFVSGLAVIKQSFQSGVKTQQIFMPAIMKDKAKHALESGSTSAYKALMNGEKVEWPCDEYIAFSVEKFPEQPHLATVQFLHKKQFANRNFYEDIDSTERITVEGSVVKWIDELAEHYGYFNSY